MKATAKGNVNYKGIWLRKGDVFDVADEDRAELAEYCELAEAAPDSSEPKEEPHIEERPRRGRRRKTEE